MCHGQRSMTVLQGLGSTHLTRRHPALQADSKDWLSCTTLSARATQDEKYAKHVACWLVKLDLQPLWTAKTVLSKVRSYTAAYTSLYSLFLLCHRLNFACDFLSKYTPWLWDCTCPYFSLFSSKYLLTSSWKMFAAFNILYEEILSSI